jgi:hypothetical protein
MICVERICVGEIEHEIREGILEDQYRNLVLSKHSEVVASRE